MDKRGELLARLLYVTVPACADHAVANATTQSEEAVLPACTWPAILDRPDVYTTACVASRTEPNCGPVTAVPPPDAAGNCTNECLPTEYAVTCGGPGGGVPLPSGCRSLPAGPGGSVQGCCPCGS
jgi:hypothetical protein